MAHHTGISTAEGASAAPAAPLVERAPAVAALAAALTSATEGEGRLIVIEGEAGAGKSRLIAEAAALAGKRGIERQLARGTLLERGYPFGLMHRLLDRPLGALGTARLGQLRAGGAGPAVDLLGGRAGPAAPSADAMFALAIAFYRLYGRLAENGPVLVAVDDLHWADRGSARTLAYLAERVEELPLALVVAIRSGESPQGADPREALTDSPAALAIGAAALSPAGSAELLEGLLGAVAPSFADAAHRAAAGNPFLLTELARTVAAEGVEPDARGAERLADTLPDAVRGWAGRRLAALPAATRGLARSLAVLEQADLTVAAAHAGLGRSAALRAADELTRTGVTQDEVPLRFAHPLIRAAVLRDIPAATRSELHHRAASLLARRGEEPPAIASHLLEAEPRGEPWAVEALRATAATALARGAAEDAVAALARAAAEPGAADRSELLTELGRARAAVNDPRALSDLERAASCARDAASRVGALAALAQTRYLAGEARGAFDAAGAALAEVEPGAGGRVEAELLLGYAMAGRQSPELLGPVREALALPRPGGPAEIIRRHAIGLVAFRGGERALAAESSHWVAGRFADDAVAEQLPPLLAIGPAFVLTGLGDWDAAEATIDRGLKRARARGSPLETAECLHERVWQRWRRGDVDGGLADIETVFELTAGAWDPAKVPMRVAHAHLLIERGLAEEAAAALALPDRLERFVAGTWGWPWLALGRAVVALALGDPGAARRHALAAGERLARIDALNPEFAPWRSVAAVAALRAGVRDEGLELATAELAIAERIGAPRARGTALVALADAVHPSRRAEMLEAAVVAFDEAGADLYRARARLALGMALRRARHPRDSRGPLREAADLAERIGARVVAERALAELRAAGARPRRRRLTGAQALTPREREIAGLAAAGLGNVEIAERLFITRKTVEGHLRTVFRKLGIARREEIAARLSG